MKKAIILLIAFITMITLTGCATTEPNIDESKSQIGEQYGLTKQVSLDGVSLRVDPAWEDTSDGFLRFEVSADITIAVSTYSNGHAGDVDAFTGGKEEPEISIEKTWSENGINYSIFSEEMTEVFLIFFIGGTENGVGFSVLAYIGGTPDESDMEMIYALFDTVEFDPSKIAAETPQSSTPSTSVSQKSEEYALSIFATIDVYYLGANITSLGDIKIISPAVSDLEDARREFTNAIDKSMTPTDDAVQELGESIIAAFYRYMDAYNIGSDEYPDEAFITDLDDYLAELNAVTGLNYKLHNQYSPE
jgi:hypothetical protein